MCAMASHTDEGPRGNRRGVLPARFVSPQVCDMQRHHASLSIYGNTLSLSLRYSLLLLFFSLSHFPLSMVFFFFLRKPRPDLGQPIFTKCFWAHLPPTSFDCDHGRPRLRGARPEHERRRGQRPTPSRRRTWLFVVLSALRVTPPTPGRPFDAMARLCRVRTSCVPAHLRNMERHGGRIGWRRTSPSRE